MSAPKTLIISLVLIWIKTGEGAPGSPTVLIDRFDEAVSRPTTLVYDPAFRTFFVTCSSKDSAASFKDEGELTFYVNDKIAHSVRDVSADWTKLSIAMTFTAGEDVNLKCVLSHPAANRTIEISFMSPNQTFDLEYTAVTLKLPVDKVELKKVDNRFGFNSRLNQEWFKRTNDSDEWKSVGTGGTLSVQNLPNPGLEWFMLRVNQKKYFDLTITSNPVPVLTYIPTTKLTITSPLNVCTKINDIKKLTCSADGDPKPELFWLKADEFDVEEFSGTSVGSSYSHSGIYKCGAVQKLLERNVVLESFQAVRVKVVSNEKQCVNGPSFL